MAKEEFSLREMIEATPQGRQWLDGVSQTLGQSDHDHVLEKLSSLTNDGLLVAPIYPLTGTNTLSLPVAARADAKWKTLTRIDHPTPADANAQLLHDLEQGADGALLVLHGSGSAYGFGIELADHASFDALFDNIFVDATSLRFDGMTAAQLSLWSDFCDRRNYDQSDLDVSFDAHDISGLENGSARLISDAAKWHDKGATAAQELGFALAEIVALMRDLSGSSVDAHAIPNRIGVALSCDADQFETMAKFRAMRLLWNQLLQAMGSVEWPLNIHATTSWRMMGRRDPWTNVLRTTMACFAAGLGGADSVTVLPHTQALGLPDAFARRVARNISLILQEESHLGKMVDPAAGAGVYDALTVSLAEAAWTIFQSLEAQGGFTAATENGTIDQILSDSRTARMSDVVTRKIVSLGNSHFAQLEAPAVDTLITRPLETKQDLEPFGNLRDGIPFEQLADRAQTLSAHTKPSVSLLCIGSRKAWKARSDFASDLFAAGGLATEILTLDSDPTLGSLDILKTPIICLCGADADYESSASALIARLRDAGAQHIVLAGRSDFAELDETVFTGCDAHAVLDRVLLVLEGLKR